MAGIGALDPRQQAHISLTYKSQQPQLSATKSYELSQIYATGRLGTRTPQALTTADTNNKSTKSKGDRPHFSRQGTEFEGSVHPPFLDKNSKWDQEGLPILLTHTQGQPLTSTGKFDGTRSMVQAPKAISAIHTYHDISPVLTTEYTRDSDKSEVSWDATINKRGTAGVYTQAGPVPPSRLETMVESLRPANTNPLSKTAVIGDPAVRKSSVDAFWNRNGSSSHLKQRDVIRVGDELGRHAVPGTPNAKLLGGKWRYLSRPVEGNHLYTDFYGRCGGTHCDYYGRTYHCLPQ